MLFRSCIAAAGSWVQLRFANRPIYGMRRSALAEGSSDLEANVLGAVTLSAAGCFGFANAPSWAALVLLLAVGRLDTRARHRWEGHDLTRLGRYSPAGAMLLGWLGGLAAGSLAGAPDPATWARHASAGVLGSAYFLAAIAKLRTTGRGWVRGMNMQLLLAERAGPSVPGRLRGRLATWPRICSSIGALGLGAELLAILQIGRAHV